jgi:hypothetical protein
VLTTVHRFFLWYLDKETSLAKKKSFPGKLLEKVTQKPGAVFLIPVKVKLAKISCVKYDLLMELSPSGFFHPAKAGVTLILDTEFCAPFGVPAKNYSNGGPDAKTGR